MLFETRPLLLLAASVQAFQTANGAMLPFLAPARTAAGADPSITTGDMTVVAQATMVVAALASAAPRQKGRARGVLALALALVVVRGAAGRLRRRLVRSVISARFKVLEGLAMGLAGVAIPAPGRRDQEGTGHASAGFGRGYDGLRAGAALSAHARRLRPLSTSALRPRSSSLQLLPAAGSYVWTAGRRLSGMHMSRRQNKAAGEAA